MPARSPGCKPEAGEAAGDARDFAIELAPGEADILMADDQRVAVGKRCRGAAQRLGEGHFQEGHIGPAGIAQCRWGRHEGLVYLRHDGNDELREGAGVCPADGGSRG